MSKNHPAPDPNKGGGEKKPTKCHVYVEPGIKIDFVEDLRKQQEARYDEDTTHQKKQLLWTKIAAVLIFIYTFFSGCQLKIAHDTFVATSRPYLGLNTIAITYLGRNAAGETTFNNFPTKETINFDFRAEIKNFGPLPGTNFQANGKFFFDGVEQMATTIPNLPATIFPTQSVFLGGQAGTANYPLLMSGQKVLIIEISTEYDGPSGHTKECVKSQYTPKENGFFNLGRCK